MTNTPLFEGPGPDAIYRDHLANGEFRIQKCNDCGKHNFYPRVLCPHCGSAAHDWVKASGKGEVYSTTAVRKRDGNHNVALVNLEEGPRMMTRIDGIEATEVRIGTPVKARIVDEDDTRFVVFDVIEGAAS